MLPEQNIYYNDSDLEYDKDIDELVFTSDVVNLSWEEKAKKFASKNKDAEYIEISVDLNTENEEINSWLSSNKSRVAELLRPIVVSLFQAEKSIKG